MVGGDEHQVVLVHVGHHVAQPLVEVLERQAVAQWVAAMPVHGVEIDQVGKAQAMPVLRHDLVHMVHAVGVALVVIVRAKAVAAQQVEGLAHGDGVEPGVVQKVHHGGAGWGEAVVVAVGGAGKVRRARAHVGARDHATHGDLGPVDEGARVLAGAVELLERNDLLVRRDL